MQVPAKWHQALCYNNPPLLSALVLNVLKSKNVPWRLKSLFPLSVFLFLLLRLQRQLQIPFVCLLGSLNFVLVVHIRNTVNASSSLLQRCVRMQGPWAHAHTVTWEQRSPACLLHAGPTMQHGAAQPTCLPAKGVGLSC